MVGEKIGFIKANVRGLKRLVDSLETIYGDTILHLPIHKSGDTNIKEVGYW